MSEFAVDVDTLARHAQRIAPVCDQIGLAGDAVRQVNLHDGAFGLLCAFLPVVVDVMVGRTDDVIVAAGETASSMADTVKAMAAEYARVDGQVASRLSALGRGV